MPRRHLKGTTQGLAGKVTHIIRSFMNRLKNKRQTKLLKNQIHMLNYVKLTQMTSSGGKDISINSTKFHQPLDPVFAN